MGRSAGWGDGLMYVLENRLKEIRLAQEKEQAEIAGLAGV